MTYPSQFFFSKRERESEKIKWKMKQMFFEEEKETRMHVMLIYHSERLGLFNPTGWTGTACLKTFLILIFDFWFSINLKFNDFYFNYRKSNSAEVVMAQWPSGHVEWLVHLGVQGSTCLLVSFSLLWRCKGYRIGPLWSKNRQKKK